MNKYNLLQKGATVHVDPYPHIVVEDALPWDIYEELERTFPENAVFYVQCCWEFYSSILYYTGL